MVWDIDYIEDEQIVITTFDGVISGPEMLEAAAARIAAGREKFWSKFIIDAQAMIAPRSATMDVYTIPTQVYKENEADRNSRIAVIKPRDPDSAWIVDFYDNLCTTRGWTAKMFDDREAALEWLRS